ncbi:MAG TPA: Holliday junction resolvase RuvX [Candidatus Saccharimonadales bacterium]|nr:Holliday junction resolvase RuvX [Candidatus Saccharimonadales bacterium]
MSPSKPTYNKVLGIDYGSKRIGLAIGDLSTRLAQPLATIGPENLILNILDIINSNQIGKVVIGLPRNLEGEDTAQTVIVRNFAQDLADRARVEIMLQDEAGTSAVARERLGKNPATGDIDKIAAAIILQDYLDSL